jgi:glycerophosphoryl diester phosphodiesterase
LALYSDRCVLISFDYAVLEAAKRLGIKRTGWVVRNWWGDSFQLAHILKPDVLFCNYEKIPDIDNVLWQGSWEWALYDVIDPDVALRWMRRGAHYIESWNIGALVSITCVDKK